MYIYLPAYVKSPPDYLYYVKQGQHYAVVLNDLL